MIQQLIAGASKQGKAFQGLGIVRVFADAVSQRAARGAAEFRIIHIFLCSKSQRGAFIVPIYAYKCAACGHEQDVLQKVSDEPLTVCPSCGASSFAKQVTAAGFQLKGSGWYVTDFRDSSKKKDGSSSADKPSEPASAAESTNQAKPASEDKPSAAAPAPAPAAPAPAPTPTPASSK